MIDALVSVFKGDHKLEADAIMCGCLPAGRFACLGFCVKKIL